MTKRNRGKQTRSLADRLRDFAMRFRVEAEQAPSERERKALLKRADTADQARRIDNWLTSPELRSPDNPNQGT